MKTSERLAKELEDAGAVEMAAKARQGYYDEFDGELPMPMVQLVCDLQNSGYVELAGRALNGEFDATGEEAEAWFEREGRSLLAQRCSRA
jgi:hypothetical protein